MKLNIIYSKYLNKFLEYLVFTNNNIYHYLL